MKNRHFVFDNKRFAHLIRREVKTSARTFLLVTASIIGIYLTGTLLKLAGNVHIQILSEDNLKNSLGFLMIIWASISFLEIAKTPGRQAYLALPASHLEKVAAKWANISLIIPITFSTAYILSSWTSSFLINSLLGMESDYSEFHPASLIRTFMVLVAVQSVLYAGSATWPRHSLFKTGLAGIGIIFFIGMTTAFFAKVIFPEDFQGNSLVRFEGNLDMSLLSDGNWAAILTFAGFLFFMTVAYFKLKEKEL